MFVYLGGKAVTHQQQGGERCLQFVGHIAHPALLLVQLGLQRASALELHRQPAATTRHRQHVDLQLRSLPLQPLGTIQAAGATNAGQQAGVVAKLLEFTPLEDAPHIDPQHPLRPRSQMIDPVVVVEQYPAQGRRVHPAQQLAHPQLAVLPALP